MFCKSFQKAVWNPKFVWNQWYHYHHHHHHHHHHCGANERLYCIFFVLLVKCVLCVFVLYLFLIICFRLLWRSCYWPIGCLFSTLIKITAVNLIVVFNLFYGTILLTCTRDPNFILARLPREEVKGWIRTTCTLLLLATNAIIITNISLLSIIVTVAVQVVLC